MRALVPEPEEDMLVKGIFEDAFLPLFHAPYFKEFMDVWNPMFIRCMKYFEVKRSADFQCKVVPVQVVFF